MSSWRKFSANGTLKEKSTKVIKIRKREWTISSLKDVKREDLINEINLINSEISLLNLNNYSNPILYRMIHNLRDYSFTVSNLCKILNIQERGYYKWIEKEMPLDYYYDEYLGQFLKTIRSEGKDWMGIRGLKREIINEHGVVYSEYKINRHLKILGLETKTAMKNIDYKKRNYGDFKIKNLLTDSKTGKLIREDDGPNKIWLADASTILSKSSQATTLRFIQ